MQSLATVDLMDTLHYGFHYQYKCTVCCKVIYLVSLDNFNFVKPMTSFVNNPLSKPSYLLITVVIAVVSLFQHDWNFGNARGFLQKVLQIKLSLVNVKGHNMILIESCPLTLFAGILFSTLIDWNLLVSNFTDGRAGTSSSSSSAWSSLSS